MLLLDAEAAGDSMQSLLSIQADRAILHELLVYKHMQLSVPYQGAIQLIMQLLTESMGLVDVNNLPCQLIHGGLQWGLTASPVTHIKVSSGLIAWIAVLHLSIQAQKPRKV